MHYLAIRRGRRVDLGPLAQVPLYGAAQLLKHSCNILELERR